MESIQCNLIFRNVTNIKLFIVRSTMPDITALGAAKAAGHAEGIGVWELEGEGVETVSMDTFLPTTTTEGKFRISMNFNIHKPQKEDFDKIM